MEPNAQLTSYMVESINGVQTVKAYNAERKVKQETEIKLRGISVSKKKLYLIKACIIISVILNVLMISVLNEGEEYFSNIFIIIVLFGINIWIDCNKENFGGRVVNPEVWGILGVAAVSVLRFVNRIETLSDNVNFGFSIIFIGIGVYLSVAIMTRLATLKKRK